MKLKKQANNQIHLTVKSVTKFAIANFPPLFTSADAGVIGHKMLYRCSLILMVVVLASTTAIASVGPDYEAQLGHSIARWTQDLDKVRSTSPESSVDLIFLCKRPDHANNLGEEYSRDIVNVENKKVIGYSQRVVVRIQVPRSGIDSARWLRRQFFVGVSYECDLDGLSESVGNAL